MSRMEKDLENDCNSIAYREFGLLNLKQLSERGVPDRLYFKDGHAFFVEFKAPNGRVSKYQSHIHRQLTQAGMSVYVVDNEEDFREICRGEI